MSKYDQEKKRMSFEDEWGHDASVQSMRRVFSFMEEAQEKLLRRLNISVFDQRLRHSRDQALEFFEKAWPLAVRTGRMAEKDAASLYLHCLARTLRLAGVDVPEEWLSRDDKIIDLLRKGPS